MGKNEEIKSTDKNELFHDTPSIFGFVQARSDLFQTEDDLVATSVRASFEEELEIIDDYNKEPKNLDQERK